MPASSSSSTSCHRFSLRQPGTLVWASSSTSATLGLPGQDRRRRPSPRTSCRGSSIVRRGTTSRSPICAAVLRATVGLDEADDDVGAALVAPPALVEHREGLADARRGAEIDAQVPRRHVRPYVAGRRQLGAEVVEGEVELEHVDARLAEEAEVAAVGVLVDQGQRRRRGRGPRPRRPAGPGVERWPPRCAGRGRSRRR